MIPGHVVDTHALLWYLYSPNRLGAAALAALDAANGGSAAVLVPVLVLAEAVMVVQKGRLAGVDAARGMLGLHAVVASQGFIVAELDAVTVLDSARLTAIPDIFDRLIVAEAAERGIPLITKDAVIVASGTVATIWD